MKHITKKSLRLNRETVRVLQVDQLTSIEGAIQKDSTMYSCNGSCPCFRAD